MNPSLKPDELHIGERVLLDAADAIRGRNKEHGNTDLSFMMISELWSSYIAHAYTARGETKLRNYDVAVMMNLVKIARSVYGYSEDNFVDGAGYTALAAMLTPTPTGKPVVVKDEKKKTMTELFPKKEDHKSQSGELELLLSQIPKPKPRSNDV